MNALSKAMMADSLSSELNLSRQDAKEIVEHFFEILKVTLESGQPIKLSGFGNFNLRDK